MLSLILIQLFSITELLGNKSLPSMTQRTPIHTETTSNLVQYHPMYFKNAERCGNSWDSRGTSLVERKDIVTISLCHTHQGVESITRVFTLKSISNEHIYQVKNTLLIATIKLIV